MSFEVRTPMNKMWVVVFWVVTPCNLVGYQRFGGTYPILIHLNPEDGDCTLF
jgi:hypothetical protein